MSKSPIVARINALLSLKGISKKQFYFIQNRSYSYV
nr:MAG TPA: hypothetical protein [Siphoviridae sp. ctoof1]